MKRATLCFLLTAAVARGAAPTPRQPPQRGDWQSSVTRAIADGEYHLSLSDHTGDFTAPNRAHDFRTRWSSHGGVTLESRTDAKAWSFVYRLRGVGRGATLQPISEVRRESVSDGRIEWQRDGLREWYANDARGVEQGFVLESRPGGDPRHPLIIEASIDGLLAFPADGGPSIVFRTPQGLAVMRLRDLTVRDATGKPMSACFEVSVGAIFVRAHKRARLDRRERARKEQGAPFAGLAVVVPGRADQHIGVAVTVDIAGGGDGEPEEHAS